MFTQKVSLLWIGVNGKTENAFEKCLKGIHKDAFSLASAENIQIALTETKPSQYDIALIDTSTPWQGQEWWEAFSSLAREVPVILMTQGEDEDFVLTAMNKGAIDFIHVDDQSPHSILKTFRHALQIFALRQRVGAMEEQYLGLQKMESVGRLALNVAHDFNNLLTVILNYSQMILSKATDDTLRNRVDAISTCAHRAASITSQFLAFGRRHRPKPQGISLSGLLTMVEPILKQSVGTEIMLSISEEEEGLKVFMDPNHLMHIVTSMVQSAQETMPHGGKLSLKTFSRFVDDEMSSQLGNIGTGDYVVISVMDTGRGFDEESAEHIFELFGGEKGEGKVPVLLSSINGLVKHASGHIQVHSEVGKGSRFDIYLPRFMEIVEMPVEEQESKKTAKAEKSLETILVVDDEDLVRKIAVDVMTENGFKVLEASNAIEALKLCEQSGSQVDLVLTDLVMPKMGGPELVRKMVARNPHLRVVYMSGYNDDSVGHLDSLETKEVFVQKPFLPKSLLGAVKDALGRNA